MSGIRSRNTKPELRVRKALHAGGYRYRVNQRQLPGSPDIVLRKFGAVILVHGCFWHGHNCSLFKLPMTRTDFWRAKIAGNQERDVRNVHQLEAKGWRICVVWECVLRGRRDEAWFDTVIQLIENWLHSDSRLLEIDHETVLRGSSLESDDSGVLFAAESARFGLESRASL